MYETKFTHFEQRADICFRLEKTAAETVERLSIKENSGLRDRFKRFENGVTRRRKEKRKKEQISPLHGKTLNHGHVSGHSHVHIRIAMFFHEAEKKV